MKKSFVKLMILAVLATVASLTLASCSRSLILFGMGESARAEYFYTAMERTAGKAASSSMKQTMSLIMELNGMDYEQTSEATITYIGEKEDFTYLEETVTTVRTDVETTMIYQDKGYADGMMFLYSREGGMQSRMKSPITPEEYNAFKTEMNADNPKILVGDDYCETMTCRQNEDKTWTATYEGFTEEGMKPFYAMLEGIEYAVTDEHKLVDVKMTCTADKDLYPIQTRIEYVFEEAEGAKSSVPEVTVQTDYEGWNNTVLAEPYDISKFTEVEDLRQVDLFLDALRDRETAESGAFKVDTRASSSFGDQYENITRIQEVTFQNYDGYRFTMDYRDGGYDYHATYRDGELTTVVTDQKTGDEVNRKTVSVRPYEAQATIQNLMDSESISALDIIDAELRNEEEGIYKFTLGGAVRKELNEQYKTAYGTDLDSFRGHINATIQDGKLQSYTYFINTTLTINGSTLNVSMSMTVTFTDVAEDGEAV